MGVLGNAERLLGNCPRPRPQDAGIKRAPYGAPVCSTGGVTGYDVWYEAKWDRYASAHLLASPVLPMAE